MKNSKAACKTLKIMKTQTFAFENILFGTHVWLHSAILMDEKVLLVHWNNKIKHTYIVSQVHKLPKSHW